MDGGFLKLVRYGVRAGNDRHILASLGEYDDQTCEDLTRVRYDFGPQDDTTPSWRHYGVDGYGEDLTNGANYGVGGVMAPGQRGRVTASVTARTRRPPWPGAMRNTSSCCAPWRMGASGITTTSADRFSKP